MWESVILSRQSNWSWVLNMSLYRFQGPLSLLLKFTSQRSRIGVYVRQPRRAKFSYVYVVVVVQAFDRKMNLMLVDADMV